MKASTLTKRLLSIIAIMLAVVMVFSGCGEGDKGDSSDLSGTTANTDEQKDADVEDGEDADEKDGDKKDDKKDKNTSKKTTSKKTTSKKTSSKTTGGSTGNTKFAKDPYSEITAELKGKEVHVLMWRKYTKSEQQQVDAFQKKTGIKVRTTVTTEQEYSTKLVSLISAKDSPDALCISSGYFPGTALKSMQPLDEKKFRLNDDCWYTEYMDNYAVNGKYYAVCMRGIWSCEDCNYVTYYSPKVLKECGVTTMPYDLYKAGKWNWQTQLDIINKVKQNGAAKSYVPFSTQSADLSMLACGVDFADYDGKKYTNNLTDVKSGSLIAKSWEYIADINKNIGGIALWDLNNCQQGKVGLFTAIAYGLYNNGAWFDNMSGGYGSDNLQAVPVAAESQSNSYTPVRPKAWGVAKNAKNPEGAAFFLRYYLDVNTVQGGMSSTFYNKQFEEVYNIITAKSTKKRLRVGSGVADYITAKTYDGICQKLTTSTKENVLTVLKSNATKLNTGINKANRDIAKKS